MSNPESVLQSAILRACGSLPDVRLFRNEVGQAVVGRRRTLPVGTTVAAPGHRAYKLQYRAVLVTTPAVVAFGLTPGSSDLIGWRRVVVTPEMVGTSVAVFLGIEVKTPTGRVEPAQKNWHEVVTAHGGLSRICRTEEEAVAACCEPFQGRPGA